MLTEAKAAGDALLAAKEALAHGSFKAWVERNCECSYRQARRYMQLAKMADVDQFDPDASIESLLHTKGKPTPKPSTFDRDDAEHAKKLHSLATRGSTEGERSGKVVPQDQFGGATL